MLSRTFEGLMKGRWWRSILQFLKRRGSSITVATSEEGMGRYFEVVLDGDGFKVKSDKAALPAAFTDSKPSFRPLRTAAEVLELVRECDSSLVEVEVVERIEQRLEEIRVGKQFPETPPHPTVRQLRGWVGGVGFNSMSKAELCGVTRHVLGCTNCKDLANKMV